MALVTTSTLPAPVQLSYDKKLLSVEMPNLIFSRFADMRSLKGNDGPTLRMERYNKLGLATVPLDNSGVTPPSSSLSSVFIDAKITFYGKSVNINEQVVVTSQSPVVNKATELLGISMRETEDALIKNMLATTASVLFSTGGVNGDNPTEMALTDIQEAVRVLMGNDAKTLSNVIEGQNKFGTAPVRNSYFGLSDTGITNDLSNISGWTYTSQYPSQSNISSAEYGSAGGVRFLVSSKGSITENASGNGEDVFNTFIVGMEAYASIKLDNYSSRFIHRDALYSGPLALNQSVAYKFAAAPVILNDSWILNLKSTRA